MSLGSKPGDGNDRRTDDKILILAGHAHSSVLRSICQGLRACGATPLLAGIEGHGQPQGEALRRLDPDSKLDAVCEPDACIDDVIAACPVSPTSIIVLEAGTAFFPRGLPDVGLSTLYLMGEDWIHADYHERILPFFDRVLTAFSGTEKLYAQRGFDHVARWYFIACSDFIERRSGPRPVDVSFWGNLDPIVQRRRNRVVEALLDLRHEGYEVSAGQGAFYRDYNDRLNEAKIVVHDGQSRQINMRVIEAMQAGCLVIAARPTDGDDPSARLFADRDEIVYFDDIPNALELVRHYVRHTEERERIAAAGYARVVEEFAVEIPARQLLDDHIHQIPDDFRARRVRRLAAAAADEATVLTHYFALFGGTAAATRAASGRDDPMVLNNLAVAEAMERRFDSAADRLEAALRQRPEMAIARANLVAVKHFSQTVTDWPAHRDWIDQQIGAPPGPFRGQSGPRIPARLLLPHYLQPLSHGVRRRFPRSCARSRAKSAPARSARLSPAPVRRRSGHVRPSARVRDRTFPASA